MGKPKKKKRTVPRLARGFRDLTAADLVARRDMITRVIEVYERYGFQALETPAIEYVDVLGKFLPEADQPDAGIFAFRYDDNEWVALRYDLTAPLSRYVAKNFQELGMPFRRYQTGSVWRLEKPEPGRFREFTQLDIDIVGAGSILADAEIVTVLAESMEALGIARGEYVVQLNDRKVLNGLLEVTGVADEVVPPVLRSLDKIDKLGPEGVRLLLGPGREDPESGDFTKGAGLEPAQIDTLLAFVDSPGSDRATYLETVAGLVGESKEGQAGLAEMRELDAILSERGLGTDQVVFTPAVVRGLAYYTGPVVEVALTFTDPSSGRPFGSVAGGGRYDGLVGRFTGQQVPATGASIGVSRLLDALNKLGKTDPGRGICPVLVTTLDKTRRADYQRLADEVRAAGIACELYVGGGGAAKQFKYADRRGFTVAIVAGPDEFEADQVSLKDLRLGRELSQAEGFAEDRKKWLESLPGQVTVPRAELVAQIREVLARHATT